MRSQTAIDSLDELKELGLEPTFADAILLNAQGLRLEAARKKNAATALDYLPRVALINDGVWFRQPAIGHDLWLAQIERLVAANDYQTILAVKAFALSRDPDRLPCLDDLAAVKREIDEYLKTLADYSRDQIFAALEYVIFGANPLAFEHPPAVKGDDAEPTADLNDGEDWTECVAVGVLHEGQVALWGLSRAELERMTRQQLQDQIARAYLYHGFTDGEAIRRAERNYYATLDEIRERLETERKLK